MIRADHRHPLYPGTDLALVIVNEEDGLIAGVAVHQKLAGQQHAHLAGAHNGHIDLVFLGGWQAVVGKTQNVRAAPDKLVDKTGAEGGQKPHAHRRHGILERQMNRENHPVNRKIQDAANKICQHDAQVYIRGRIAPHLQIYAKKQPAYQHADQHDQINDGKIPDLSRRAEAVETV